MANGSAFQASYLAMSLPAQQSESGAAAKVQRLLIIDNDREEQERYSHPLSDAGYEVVCAPSESEALDQLKAASFNAVLCALGADREHSLGLLQSVRQVDLDIPVLVLTDQTALSTAIATLEHGALRYLLRPIAPPQLVEIVGQAVLLHRMAKAKRDALMMLGTESRHQLGDLAGASARLDNALASLWMAYQPIIDWRGKKVFGYEALVRSEEQTLPHPPALFDSAERVGRLLELSRHIRARVASDLVSNKSGVDDGCAIFVNLHTRDLLDEELYDVSAPLSAHAKRVVLEITERTALDEIHDVGGRVSRLRALGFRIAIDDLGAGYAGLSTFAQLEPEVVKLDMSLVRDVHTRSTKRKIITTMANLCHELGMQVIAEGIETPAQRDIVDACGCELMQGYLFGRPAQGFIPPTF